MTQKFCKLPYSTHKRTGLCLIKINFQSVESLPKYLLIKQRNLEEDSHLLKS
jgi:hypothetical protein